MWLGALHNFSFVCNRQRSFRNWPRTVCKFINFPLTMSRFRPWTHRWILMYHLPSSAAPNLSDWAIKMCVHANIRGVQFKVSHVGRSAETKRYRRLITFRDFLLRSRKWVTLRFCETSWDVDSYEYGRYAREDAYATLRIVSAKAFGTNGILGCWQWQ